MITLEKLQREAEADGRRPVVGALILDERGRVFVQRRGPDRAFLPNGWDLVGGHVEPGESLLEALRREVHEETGWAVVGEPQLVFVGDWWTDPDDPSTARREFDFLVDVEGDLRRPALEWPKHTESRWIGSAEVGLLDENAGRDDGLVRHLAEMALRSAVTERPRFAHATIFLEADVAEPIEVLRRRWDPALAYQISAHVTVAYPSDSHSIDDLLERLLPAAATVGPFELMLGSPLHRVGPHWWVGVEVADPDGGWRRLRDLLVPAARQPAGVEPHVTVVHPRHSNLGEQAWRAVADSGIGGRFSISEITATVFDGRRWHSVERIPLAGVANER
jgi:8-oxo-dGTP diphosphatase